MAGAVNQARLSDSSCRSLLRQVDEIRLLRVEPWEETTAEHIASVIERHALAASAVPAEPASPSRDTDAAIEPIMTEAVREMARRVSHYRWVLQSLGVDTRALMEEGDRSNCPAYRGDGTCRSGCWEEPICQTGEPEGGWPLARLRAGLRLLDEHKTERPGAGTTEAGDG